MKKFISNLLLTLGILLVGGACCWIALISAFIMINAGYEAPAISWIVGLALGLITLLMSLYDQIQ